ncbi:MAG: family 43 glycosylhydrolase [Lachnospiraceae bacterium]|nr:family 43 glycosylhydrolase [Lachnospiraceae bacterium]
MEDFRNAADKTSYTNPVICCDYSDPDVIRSGSDYYMVASSFCNVPGLPVLHSRDLVNWELINYVLDRLPDERYAEPVHGCGVWAPSIRYHEGTYYVCFPMPDEGIYMCSSDNPTGSWSDPVMIKEGPGWIDPCPFWDDDGRAYLVYGVAKSRIGYKSVLYIQEMGPDGMGLMGEPVRVFDGNTNDQTTIEGPKLYKRNGLYYIFAPAGGVKTGWQTVLRSRNIYGPYEYRVVMKQGDTDINGPHQGAWVDTVTGEDWFIHFRDVYSAGRIVYLEPMKWENDWPVIGVAQPGRDWGEPVAEYKIPDTPDTRAQGDIERKPYEDRFNTPGLEWQWNANPRREWLDTADGRIVLNAARKTGVYGDIPSILLQKWPAFEFSFYMDFDLSSLTPGDEAGIISLGMEYGVLSFLRTGEDIRVMRVFGKQVYGKILPDHTDEEPAEIAVLSPDTKEISIKYLVERTGTRNIAENDIPFPEEKVTVSYRTDSASYITGFEMIAEPGRWVGVKAGFFCVSDKDGSEGAVTISDPVYHRIYHNPVVRGFFPDPSVIRVGTDYYMVNSTFQYFPAIVISHSTDMVHWEIIGHAITDPEYLDLSDIRDSHGIWAPDITYENGRFYITATLRLNGDGNRNNNVLRRQLVVWSDKPEGPYSKPVWIEADNIDPSFFTDDDSKHYMLISPGVNLIPLNDDCTKITGEERQIWAGTGERCPEGPHLFKKGEYYYAILAEGGTGYGHGINVARSKSLFGPYEESPYNPVLRQFDEDAPIQRCGHGKLVEDGNGDWWVYYLCGRPNRGRYTTVGRETALDRVKWLDDGWFVINDASGPGLVGDAPDLPAMNPVRYARDDFDKDVLDPEWEFVRNPSRADYSLTERPGWFRMWTRDGQLYEIRAKNTLLRREQELCYTAETKLDFYPTADGEQAGLTCYYSTATYVRLSLCYENERRLQLVINRNRGEEIVASTGLIREQPVFLRVVTDHLTRSFYYSYDAEEWILVATLNNCVYLCDEGVPDDPKRHTGTLVGIYANNGGRGSRIPADFDYFEYKDTGRIRK